MARSVYFGFHYEDVSSFRANVVRNSWVTMKKGAGNFIDKSIWEEAQRKGPAALKKLIGEGLQGTSVTIILVGSETFDRRWVKYEIIKSFTEGKGILPIYINRIPSKNEGVKAKGVNPLERLAVDVSSDCKTLTFYELSNGQWTLSKDLPTDNNRTTNSIYFENVPFGKYKGGKKYKFSDLFHEGYDWITDDGYENFSEWIEDAADEAGR
jgi:hypothetical protein